MVTILILGVESKRKCSGPEEWSKYYCGKGSIYNGCMERGPASGRYLHYGTMVENGKKHRQNSHLINHFPTSEGVSEVSERANE